MKYGGGIAPETYLDFEDELNIIFFATSAEIDDLCMGQGGGDHDLGYTCLTVNQNGCAEFFNGTPEDYQKKYPYVKDTYIAINQEKLWYDKNNDPSIENNQYDLFATLLHEIGHSLGLNHALDSSNNGSNDSKTMYPKGA
jgi:hypothetical protein